MNLLEKDINLDYQAHLDCILRKKEPERVFNIELYLDEEIIDAVAERFDLVNDLNPSDPHFKLKRDITVHRFLGYDMFRVTIPGFDFPTNLHRTNDATTEEGQIRDSRDWVDEHTGPIQSWEDFENYPWPDISKVDVSAMEWYEKNLPEDMAVFELTTHVFEILSWIMGFETLCYKIFEEPDLVEALAEKIGKLYLEFTEMLCQFPRMGFIWGSDDMGFKTQSFLSPDWIRKLILPWHKKSVEISHKYNKPYFLHSCGNLENIMDDLIDDVKIDAKHSFEDEIEPVTSIYKKYGERVGILGGIDVTFLCQADEKQIRKRVRETLDICQPGGGYSFGTGNSVANYIPLDNYLVMLDEARRYSG